MNPTLDRNDVDAVDVLLVLAAAAALPLELDASPVELYAEAVKLVVLHVVV